jgi:hypothetical protein
MSRFKPRCFVLECGDQKRQNVFNGDWLCRSLHPARADHEWQSLHECSDQFERQAAGTDDDRRAKLNHLSSGLREDLPDLLSAAEMR